MPFSQTEVHFAQSDTRGVFVGIGNQTPVVVENQSKSDKKQTNEALKVVGITKFHSRQNSRPLSIDFLNDPGKQHMLDSINFGGVST